MTARMTGCATPQATTRYAARFADRAAGGHFRSSPHLAGLVLSSIGLGSYLGEADEVSDRCYTEAVVAAVEGGINVLDSASNYRFQRSERAVGEALRRLAAKGFAREELLICTKGGYLTPDASLPADPNAYFFKEYVQPGIFRSQDVVAGCHVMTPRFLADQLERSLRNLGLACVDVYYLHNPETQAGALSKAEFSARLRAAFEFLESAVAEGKVRAYGVASWDGFRRALAEPGCHSLAEMVAIARELAGEGHHFRFVQLPFNLAMTEALTNPNQILGSETLPMIPAADRLGVNLVASASLLQGQVAQGLPEFVAEALGLANDRERALQFVRSAPGIAVALVGMGRPQHVKENLRLVGLAPASPENFLKLFERGA